MLDEVGFQNTTVIYVCFVEIPLKNFDFTGS